MVKKVKKKTTKKATPKTAKKKAVKKKVTKKRAVKKTAKKATPKTVAKKKKTVKRTARSSKKTSIVKRKRRARKTKLTSKELTHFRDLLIERLKEITGSVNHIETEALKTSRLDSSGDLSSMPIHMADIGSDNYEQEFALGLMDSERKIVVEIYDALKRIQNGTYGICDGTGEPIPKMRLEGIPWTRYCVKYAEMLEKGLVEEPDHDYFDEQVLEQDQEDMDEWYDEDSDEDDEDDDRDAFFYGYGDEDDESEDELQ